MLWKTILTEAVNRGLTPPVFTGYVELTVGGTLSVGGISTDGRQGAQVDNVRALFSSRSPASASWGSIQFAPPARGHQSSDRPDARARPYFRVPQSQTDWVYLFDVLTSAPLPGPNEAFVAEKLERNRGMYERARAAGGTLYPISAVPMTADDWAQQYGPTYATFGQLKQQYDPDGILTPGPRIFG